MYYRIRHLTRFAYSDPVYESLMELRMHPRTEGNQRCLDYKMTVTPKAQIHLYRDHLGNSIHHFGIPGPHRNLQITAESVVEMKPFPELPLELGPGAWAELDKAVEDGDFWPKLLPSTYAKPSELLLSFMQELGIERRDDPLMLVREINSKLFNALDYVPQSTRVDSPIDEALSQRKGVCQDMAHIMITVLRQLGIPARYVSGYLFHRAEDRDRSSDGATHAWVEAYLPTLGWIGFDPTNDLIASERHVRTAIGRDYADVPPTRGVLKGKADSKLTVAVGVSACEELPPELAEMVTEWDADVERDLNVPEDLLRQQEQMQQQ
ncbi:transglutaminase family protein [Paludibaculum fermentans]|uniref:transglutaminase family protein n=1 Tax=Paludibaculum fermentans TaxID=1473598 RepID=UPI003EBE6943